MTEVAERLNCQLRYVQGTKFVRLGVILTHQKLKETPSKDISQAAIVSAREKLNPDN